MIFQKPNWYGINHGAINTKFEGELSFVNEFCVNGEYQPSAVYRAKTPNKAKGHKKYMLLTQSGSQWYVRGMSPQKMAQFRYQDALHCLSCDSVIYSVNRHDFRFCACKKVSIDGGRDYTKIAYEPKAKFKSVTVDLLYDIVSYSK